jgi:spore maturation protein SpmA
MLNWIWLGLVVAAVILGGFSGQLDAVTKAAFKSCETAVMTIAIPYIGLIALWLGVMRLAEKAGLVEILARAMRPVMRRLFPDVPPDHPAMGSMLMNMAANMLGLGNAATPLGLRAMQDLETLNPRPGTATNAMCTFLAVNTSSIQLIPASTVAFMAAAGARDPAAIIGTAFLATLCSTIAGITAVKFLEKLPGYRLPPLPAPEPAAARESAPQEKIVLSQAPPLPVWAYPILLLFFGAFAWFAAQTVIKENPQSFAGFVTATVQAISLLAVPFLLAFFPLFAALKRLPVYEEFVEGAKEGFHVAVRIIPYLIAILVAVGMFRAAGGIEMISRAVGPALAAVGFPVELLPLVLMRPLSGGGANGIFVELIQPGGPAGGPDSLISRMAGSIMGSTETTFYVIAVYFGSVAIRRTRHAVPAGLIADLTGVAASILICRLVFGS